MALVDDAWNPNNWNMDWDYRIYGDDYANIYCIVDQIDYQYLIQWRWRPKESKKHKGTRKPKVYLFRPGHETIGEGIRRQPSIYIHQVVMDRKGDPKPKTNKKLIIDHKNGDGLDCRRVNLRWATISFNNKNIYGSHERELFDGL